MNQKIQITATIQSPINKVWEYWTNPIHITKWNFATPEWHCPSATNDLKVGGKYVARMEAKDGSFGFDFAVTYTQIENLKFISYIMEDGRVAETKFVDNGTSAFVETVFDAETENPIELQQNGWQSILNNFKNYVEKN